MKRLYKAPRIKAIDGVFEYPLLTGSHDIETVDNNGQNGGGTFGDENLGINYGEDHTGGDLNEGNLE